MYVRRSTRRSTHLLRDCGLLRETQEFYQVQRVREQLRDPGASAFRVSIWKAKASVRIYTGRVIIPQVGVPCDNICVLSLSRVFESTGGAAVPVSNSPDKAFPPLSKYNRCRNFTPTCLYEQLPILPPAFPTSMLILSCVVLASPLIVVASGGISPPVGVFVGLLSPFRPQVSRLHSRQARSSCQPIMRPSVRHHQFAYGAIISLNP